MQRLTDAARLMAISSVATAVLAAAAPAAAEQAVAVRQNPAHTSSTSDPALAPPLRALWATKVGDQPTDLYFDYPIVADGRIFVPDAVDGDTEDIVGLDAANGGVLWHRSSTYGIGMAYDAGTLFANAWDHGVEALDPATGAVRWATPIGAESNRSAPTAADGRVVVVHDTDVFALRESDGSQLWTQHTYGSDAYAALVDHRVFLDHVGEQVYELQPDTGDLVWHHQGPGTGGGFAALAVAGGRIWAADDDRTGGGGVVLAEDGGAPVGSYSGWLPAVSPTAAVAPTATTHLQARDPSSGHVRWDADEGAPVGQPLIVDGTVYAPLADGRLIGVSLATGATVWTGHLPAPAVTVAAGEGRLVATGGGWVAAFTGAGLAPPGGQTSPTAPTGGSDVGAGSGNGTSSPGVKGAGGATRHRRRSPDCRLRSRPHLRRIAIRCRLGIRSARVRGWLRSRHGRPRWRFSGRIRHHVLHVVRRSGKPLRHGRYGLTLVVHTRHRRWVVRRMLRR